ncbi:NAD(P)-dependent oxidoreductase [soil metagenome]
MEQSPVLITGATGFVGANVVAKAAERGWRTLALDLAPPESSVEALWRPHRELIEFVCGDVKDRPLLERLISVHGVQQVVHGATITPDARLETEDPIPTLEVGVLGTAATLWAARSLVAGRIVLLSSGSIYKPVSSDDAVLDEGSPLRTSGIYPLTKICGEWMARQLSREGSMNIVSARVAACYGPLERNTGSRTTMSAVWQMVRSAREDGYIVLSDRERTLDFTHVQDIAAGVCHLLAAPSLDYETYNISSGSGYTYQRLAECVARTVPGTQIIHASDNGNTEIGSDKGNRRGRLDINRIQTDTDFKPQYDLLSGVEQYVGWLEEHDF